MTAPRSRTGPPARGRRWCWCTAGSPTTPAGGRYCPTWSRTPPSTPWTGGVAAPAATARTTTWRRSGRTSPPWSTRPRPPPGQRSTCTATRTAACARTAARRSPAGCAAWCSTKGGRRSTRRRTPSRPGSGNTWTRCWRPATATRRSRPCSAPSAPPTRRSRACGRSRRGRHGSTRRTRSPARSGRSRRARPRGPGRAPGRVPAPVVPRRHRARLTALVTACSDAVTMSGSMPTPHTVRPATSHST